MFIASLVLGILSILFCYIPVFGIILALTALGISITSLCIMKKNKEKPGRGMALAGFITSIVGTVLALIVTLGLIFATAVGTKIINDPDFATDFSNLGIASEKQLIDSYITLYLIGEYDEDVTEEELLCNESKKPVIVNKYSDLASVNQSFKRIVATSDKNYCTMSYALATKIKEKIKNFNSSDWVIDENYKAYYNKKLK